MKWSLPSFGAATITMFTRPVLVAAARAAEAAARYAGRCLLARQLLVGCGLVSGGRRRLLRAGRGLHLGDLRDRPVVVARGVEEADRLVDELLVVPPGRRGRRRGRLVPVDRLRWRAQLLDDVRELVGEQPAAVRAGGG